MVPESLGQADPASELRPEIELGNQREDRGNENVDIESQYVSDGELYEDQSETPRSGAVIGVSETWQRIRGLTLLGALVLLITVLTKPPLSETRDTVSDNSASFLKDSCCEEQTPSSKPSLFKFLHDSGFPKLKQHSSPFVCECDTVGFMRSDLGKETTQMWAPHYLALIVAILVIDALTAYVLIRTASPLAFASPLVTAVILGMVVVFYHDGVWDLIGKSISSENRHEPLFMAIFDGFFDFLGYYILNPVLIAYFSSIASSVIQSGFEAAISRVYSESL